MNPRYKTRILQVHGLSIHRLPHLELWYVGHVERTYSGDVDISLVALSLARLDRPQLGLLIPRGLGDLLAKLDPPLQVKFVGELVEVLPDLATLAIGLGPPGQEEDDLGPSFL